MEYRLSCPFGFIESVIGGVRPVRDKITGCSVGVEREGWSAREHFSHQIIKAAAKKWDDGVMEAMAKEKEPHNLIPKRWDAVREEKNEFMARLLKARDEPVSDRDAYLKHRRMMNAPPLCLKERLLQNAVKHGMSETQAEDWLEESWNQEDPTTAALLALEQRVLELEQQLEWHVDRYQRQRIKRTTDG